MARHVLWPFAWRDFISLLIEALLPEMVKEGKEPKRKLTYQRYCLARMEDGCMLCPHRGRNSERHGPIYMRAREADRAGKEWMDATLTMNDDGRWQIRFTHIPDWVRQVYDSNTKAGVAVRSEYRTFLQLARPRSGRGMTVPQLICWWAYGKPHYPYDQATHFVCDRPGCINPRHLG